FATRCRKPASERDSPFTARRGAVARDSPGIKFTPSMCSSSETNKGGPADKLVVVNADDLGLSPGVNRGIIEAHERGIVTSASLMVRWPAAAEAAAYARSRPQLGVGLHL